MSLARTMARRQGRRERLYRLATRDLVRRWAEQEGIAMAAAMRAFNRGELVIEIDEARDRVRVRPAAPISPA